jgi:hypothetical protein
MNRLGNHPRKDPSHIPNRTVAGRILGMVLDGGSLVINRINDFVNRICRNRRN